MFKYDFNVKGEAIRDIMNMGVPGEQNGVFDRAWRYIVLSDDDDWLDWDYVGLKIQLMGSDKTEKITIVFCNRENEEFV